MSNPNKDPYTYPDSHVLINKFDIRDAETLSRFETIAFQANTLLPLPQGELDLTHLKALHKHFFGDLYEWAGESRTVDIAKDNSFFAHHGYVEKELNKLFQCLKNESYLQHLEHDVFCDRLSYYFNEINAAHAFREGNGRTQREFCGLIAEQAGYKLNWSSVGQDRYLQASIAGFSQGDYQPMTEIFKQMATPLKLDQAIQLSEEDLSENTSQQLYEYVEKQLKLTGLVKQKNTHLITNKPLSQAYAQQAKALSEELKALGQTMLKDPTAARFLKQPYLVSLNKQGGFSAIYTRLKEHSADKKDRLAVLRYAEGHSRVQNSNLSQKLTQTKK